MAGGRAGRGGHREPRASKGSSRWPTRPAMCSSCSRWRLPCSGGSGASPRWSSSCWESAWPATWWPTSPTPAWPSRVHTRAADGSTWPTRPAGWRWASRDWSRSAPRGPSACLPARLTCGPSPPCPISRRRSSSDSSRSSVRDGVADQQVLVAGAIAVTGLVSVRQYLTSRQNTRLLAQRLHSEERFQEILRNASDAVVVVDSGGTITYATPSTPALIAGEPPDPVGSAITSIVQPEDAPLLRELLRAAGERAGGSGTIACRSSSTPPRDLEVGVVNLLANGLVAGLVVTFRDVTERLAFEGELQARALHDPLTGPGEPRPLQRPARPGTQARPPPSHPTGRPVPRPGQLQGRQRHARPHDRRRGPRGGRPTPADRPASRGHGRAAGRRRVRRAHRGHRRRQRGDRRRGAHPPGARRALRHRRS